MQDHVEGAFQMMLMFECDCNLRDMEERWQVGCCKNKRSDEITGSPITFQNVIGKCERKYVIRTTAPITFEKVIGEMQELIKSVGRKTLMFEWGWFSDKRKKSYREMSSNNHREIDKKYSVYKLPVAADGCDLPIREKRVIGEHLYFINNNRLSI